MFSNKLNLLLCLSLFLSASVTYAGDVVVEDVAARKEMVRRAHVWLAPEWIDQNFNFSSSLDLYKGAPTPAADALLEAELVACQTTPEDQNFEGGNNTKFYCSLMNPSIQDPATGRFSLVVKKNGKRDKIKVKYHSIKRYNQEIFGEVLSTRLMWALGFGADKIYPVEKVLCYGCTADPFNDRQVDATQMQTPRLFVQAVVERKFPIGDEIIFQSHLKVKRGASEIDDTEWRPTSTGQYSGWSFKESMNTLAEDPVLRAQQQTERDALRLLAVFMFHIDMKPANNRLVCLEPDAAGGCPGKTLLMMNDVGSSFGVKDAFLSMKKVDFNTFATKPVWLDPSKCQASLSSMVIRDKTMKNPVISEAGRKFLARLLAGFIAGPEGRKRVEDLFRAARIETQKKGTTVAAWSDAFIARANQVIYPLGAANPNFACPQ